MGHADDNPKVTVTVKGESIVVNDIDVYLGEAIGDGHRRVMYENAHQEALKRYVSRDFGSCIVSAAEIKKVFNAALKDFRAKLKPAYLEDIAVQTAPFDAEIVRSVVRIANNCSGFTFENEKEILFLASDLYKNGWGVDIDEIKATELEYKAIVVKFLIRLNAKIKFFKRMTVAESLQEPNSKIETYVYTQYDPEYYCRDGTNAWQKYLSSEKRMGRARHEVIPFIKQKLQETSAFMLTHVAACNKMTDKHRAHAYFTLLINWQDGAFFSPRDDEALSWVKAALSLQKIDDDQRHELREIEAKIYLFSKFQKIGDVSRAASLLKELVSNRPRANYYLGEIRLLRLEAKNNEEAESIFLQYTKDRGFFAATLHSSRLKTSLLQWDKIFTLEDIKTKLSQAEVYDLTQDGNLGSAVAQSALSHIWQQSKQSSEKYLKWDKKAACGDYNLAQIQMALSLNKLSEPKWSDWYHIALLNPRNTEDVIEKIERFGERSSTENKHAKLDPYAKLLAQKCDGEE